MGGLLVASECARTSTLWLGATNALASVAVFAAQLPENGFRQVCVQVVNSAETARIAFVGGSPGGVSAT